MKVLVTVLMLNVFSVCSSSAEDRSLKVIMEETLVIYKQMPAIIANVDAGGQAADLIAQLRALVHEAIEMKVSILEEHSDNFTKRHGYLAYQRVQGELFLKLLDLELVLLKKDAAKAKVIWEEIRAFKDKGHKAFRQQIK